MNKIMLRALLPLCIFVLLAFFLWRGLYENPHEIASPLLNKPTPYFNAPNLLTNKTLTSDIFKNHVTLLNVFATWCTSCQAEHSVLMDIRNSKAVMMVGLNYKDDRNKSLEWLKEGGNPYSKIIFDSDGKIGIDFGVYGTPETFLIDAKGIIRYKYIGPISPTEWEHVILPEVIKLEDND